MLGANENLCIVVNLCMTDYGHKEKIIMPKKSSGQKPGEKAKNSGQYVPVGPRGGKGGDEITVIKNKPLPPTPKKNQEWVIVDPTDNKSGRG